MRLVTLISRGVALVEDTLLVSLLTALIGLGAYQIGMRNLGGSAPAWIEELMRVIVLWLAMTGAMAAARHYNHITIDLFSRLASGRARRALTIATSLFTFTVSALVAWYCFDFVKIEYEFGSTVLNEVSAWTVQLIMPVGFGVIALRYLIRAGAEAVAFVRNIEDEQLQTGAEG